MAFINGDVVEKLREQLTCALCRDIFNEPFSLVPCLHSYCKECIEMTGQTCPMCRSRVERRVKSFTLESFLDILKLLENSKPDIPPTFILAAMEQMDLNMSNTEVDFSIGRKKPCRDCDPDFSHDACCPIPITPENQSTENHLLCHFCYEYMPSKGEAPNTPGLDQCCNFCGVISCDNYWGCSDQDDKSKLYALRDVENIRHIVLDFDHLLDKDQGHLNLYEISLLEQHLFKTNEKWVDLWFKCLDQFDKDEYRTAIAQKMIPIADKFYKTRQLPHNYAARFNLDSQALPSYHLRACYSCLVNIVNGQIFGYWSENDAEYINGDHRVKCSNGYKCLKQWDDLNHATVWSHTRENQSGSTEFFEITQT
ncbi:hypothetical protein K501DRAFT_282684 [Backusella circina FSU 941]|nr:hypothetical protein K501DRAFT_282684 [Backusella circina FSU 941]